MEKLNNRAETMAKKSVAFRTVFNKVRKIFRMSRYYFGYYIKYKVDDKMILFESFKGEKFCDSPKAIYQQLVNDKRCEDYTFVWVLNNGHEEDYDLSENTIVVAYDTKECFKYYAKAKYLVRNSIFPPKVVKKKNQVYLQTWHGTPLKKLGCDIEVDHDDPNSSVKEIKERYRLEARLMDYMLSPSSYTTEKLISSFDLKGAGKEHIMIEEGYPRNEYLFKYTDDDVTAIKKRLNIPMDKKVLLYAPTYRDSSHIIGEGYFYLPNTDFELFQKELKDEYVILFRAHYFVEKTFDFEKYKGFIYNVSGVKDINDLFIVSDILVTDYSSSFFDFANLRKPILFFMYDLEYYSRESRGFYMGLEELPGPILRTEKEVVEAIRDLDSISEQYKDLYQMFNDKFNYLDNPEATKKVIERIYFDMRNRAEFM